MPELPPLPRLQTPFWQRLHLVSLEAPLIAMAWAAALAQLHRVPLMPGVLPGLGLSVWIIYVTDRLLDTAGKADAELDTRHFFHRRFRALLLTGAGLGALLAGWLAFWVVPADLMWHCLTLSVPVLLYLGVFAGKGSQLFFRGLLPLGGLTLVGFILASPAWRMGFKISLVTLILSVLLLLSLRRCQERLRTAFHKDVAGGVLFALGCTAWSRFIQNGSDPIGGFVEFVMLTCLFISNLSGISSRSTHHRWLAAGLGAVGGTLALVSQGGLAESMQTLAWACAGGFLGLLALDARRNHLTHASYRVLADGVVLVPALVIYVLR